LAKIGSNMPTTTNNMARVHPALPSYSVVVPAPELLSINVAVVTNIGSIETFRKGDVWYPLDVAVQRIIMPTHQRRIRDEPESRFLRNYG
jgi:hypothetical protein